MGVAVNISSAVANNSANPYKIREKDTFENYNLCSKNA